MKNSILNLTIIFLSVFTSASVFTSCKKHFDEPPVQDYPILIPNATISQIKARHTLGNNPTLITDSFVVEAIVVSSDEAGNFYKQLIVQDDSAGIEMRIEMSNIFNEYPVGRKVWIKCKGLYVGDYQGNHQLTINSAGDRIPEGLLSQYLIGGPKNQPVVPKVVSILDVKNSTNYRNMLIELSNTQFASADTNQTYADAAGQASLNRSVQDCNGNTIILRSSGFSTFASERTPGGNGRIVGVHTNFGTDAQLYIRDTDDVNYNGNRCSISIGGNLINISTLRAAFGGTIPTNSKINAYVISDRTTSNIVGQNMVVMDATAGITVRFTSTHSFNEGDQVEIPLDGATLSEFNGLLQLEGIQSGAITVVSSGNAVPPTTVTVADLLNNSETYESRLIKVLNSTLSGSSTYSGTLALNDGTGAIDLFTRFGATFASNSVPCGNLEITGIMGQFTTYQVQLRNPSTDVVGGTPCGSGASLTNISDLRAQYTGAAGTVTANTKVRGIVISDRTTSNLVGQNLVIQDSLGYGITLRFAANHSVNLGDKLEVNVSGGTIDQFNGLTQVSNLALTTITVVSSGNSVTPRVATVSQVLANAETWESTLIQIQGCTISGTTYGTSNTVSDGSGSLSLYTRTGATFAGTAVTAGTVNVTGILSQFDTTAPTTGGYQFLLRNLSDIN
jgi:hypothetical protein